MQRGVGVYAPLSESIDSLIERMYNEDEPEHTELPELPELILPMEQALIDKEWNGGGVISKQFVSALAQDHVALNVVSGGDIKGYLMEKYPEAFSITNVMSETYLKPEYRGIADILNGLSGGRQSYGFRHSVEYWRRNGALETEAWAQFGRILYENDAEVIKMLFELLPNLVESAKVALKGLK